MATVSARSVDISAQLLATATIDALLKRVRDADEVSFQLNVAFNADLPKILMLAAALSRRERRLNVYFAKSGPSDGVRESLAQTLLGPVLGHITETREGILSSDVGFRQRGYVDPERRLFCTHTSRLDGESRDRFLDDFSECMRGAGIVVPERILKRVAVLAFEPNQNAEEHGSMRVDDTSDVFRCLVARVHDRPGPDLALTAHDYIRSYHEQGHTKGTRWLELVIVDAGMGLSFPLFYIRARAMQNSVTRVYEADEAAERGIFTEVLCKERSTKGHWGTSFSAQTTTGKGHRFIRRNILSMHGYAAVRAGRCFGSITHPHAAEATIAELNEANYDIETKQHEMFEGTVWHMLVPLDQQLTLAL